jgi:hypothetical protein
LEGFIAFADKCQGVSYAGGNIPNFTATVHPNIAVSMCRGFAVSLALDLLSRPEW